MLAKSPADYELEVTNAGHLARSLKFTVAADGGFDSGAATVKTWGSSVEPVPVSRPFM